ncbi:ABC transporter substrate-binding protein [Pseudofrankia inefficax]|uniref:Thiamine pyrimidine synthase n=1 Tax=Pseudofrankia inefficax (strain DSM 45817 / CECT 9037 / DDB 130130 / EuI1c) TaxID=298654 RepID=E3IYG3_PSEI1|nr:ABC transporter substrate-binding protein [Pseudofrankia inefficax]ADP83908.1 putative ABC transporter substrate binding protein [Pseudofrankia inefficax]
MKRRLAGGLAAGLAVALALAACGSSSGGGSTGSTSSGLTPVKLQLQWFTQAQFAGYIAAEKKGYYKDAGLDVKILEGGTDIVPQTVLAQGKADYAIAWVPKALASREQGAQITDVAQIFQRSGTLQVSFKDKNITGPAALKGKKVGDWGFGNEYELFAGMTKAGVDPSKDITLVQQQFDMKGLISGDVDAAQAMSYNEYAQVLEATNPATGKLYQPSDFNVINWNDVGTAMLQDAIWANTSKLQSDKKYQDTTTKFVEASIKGWIYCRDNAADCRDLVVAAGSKLGASHQLWQTNEVNKLIWPSPNGIGLVDKAAWDQTVSVAKGTKNADGQTVLTKDPEGLAYTNDYVNKALADLKGSGVDVVGSGFKPQTVTLAANGA